MQYGAQLCMDHPQTLGVALIISILYMYYSTIVAPALADGSRDAKSFNDTLWRAPFYTTYLHLNKRRRKTSRKKLKKIVV